jgi:hypothetical protein
MRDVFSPYVAARHDVASTNSTPLVIAIVNIPPPPPRTSSDTQSRGGNVMSYHIYINDTIITYSCASIYIGGSGRMLLGRVVQNSKISVRVDLYPKSFTTNISANTQQSSDKSLQAQFTKNPITAHWRNEKPLTTVLLAVVCGKILVRMC